MQKCFMYNSHFVTQDIKICTQGSKFNKFNHFCFIKRVLEWNQIFCLMSAQQWKIQWLQIQFGTPFIHAKGLVFHTPLLLYHQSTHQHRQTTSRYYYVHSFDLTNSLKSSWGSPWIHRSRFENYCPTHLSRAIANVTSLRNFTTSPSLCHHCDLYKLLA